MPASPEGPPLNLDHASTTPLLPEAAEAMQAAAGRYPANPASMHRLGQAARRALEDAREQIADLLGARQGVDVADQVVFTSGGTEANNLAIAGLVGTQPGLAISAAEHPSVSEAARRERGRGRHVESLPIDQQGVVSGAEVAGAIEERQVGVVSVQMGSNETGAMQPVAELAELCRRHGALLHTDAVQAVGKVEVDFAALEVDALTCTAHKFHGPPGIGALLIRHDAHVNALLVGGNQQAGIRAGTQTVALACGMAAALTAWKRAARDRVEQMLAQRARLEAAICEADPEAVILSTGARRLPHIVNAAFPGVDRQGLVIALDLAGVACSTGSACASGSSEPSPTLIAMGLPEALISGSIRFSLGATTTDAEISLAAQRISSTIKQLRSAQKR